MPKNESKKQKNGKKGKSRIKTIIASFSAAIIVLSIIAIPSFAVNDGNETEPNTEPQYMNSFLPVENLVSTFASNDSYDTATVCNYVNSFGMTQLANTRVRYGDTFMSWVRDGNILMNSTLSYSRSLDASSDSGYFMNQSFAIATTNVDVGALSNFELANSDEQYILDRIGIGLQFGAFTYDSSQFVVDSGISSLFEIRINYHSTYGNNPVELEDVYLKVRHYIEYFDDKLDDYSTVAFDTYHIVDYIGNSESQVVIDVPTVLYANSEKFGGDFVQIRSYQLFASSRFCFESNNTFVTALDSDALYSIQARVRRFSVRSSGYIGLSPTTPFIAESLIRPVYLESDFNILDWAVNSVESFLSLPLFILPNGLSITLGTILGVIVVCLFAMVVLKFFYGG